MTTETMFDSPPPLSFWKRFIRSATREAANERRNDPARLAAVIANRRRVADLLESVAAALLACDALLIMKGTCSPWVTWLGLPALAVAVLGDAWFSRYVGELLQRRADSNRAEAEAGARSALATAEVVLSRQRLMTFRQRCPGADVASALLAMIRRQNMDPAMMPGSVMLNELDLRLGMKRTNEVLPEIAASFVYEASGG
ncbi:MAG TPA: hypothetical protein VFN10_17195 [Thermoanaerobaculia bacterium]|nr:hypothetical protein [Thermoanaerobaculia bacterium]